jgi:hypothetical protein
VVHLYSNCDFAAGTDSDSDSEAEAETDEAVDVQVLNPCSGSCRTYDDRGGTGHFGLGGIVQSGSVVDSDSDSGVFVVV